MSKIQEFRKWREEYGVTQTRLAECAGITRTYLADLESGRSPLNERMATRIEDALYRLDPDSGLNLMIDYVRIRFKTTDARYVIEQILGMKMEHLLHEDYGYYGYEEHYEFGHIFVMSSVDEEKGTLLELKGQGSRQYEGILEAQGRTWYDFFSKCLSEGCVFKRVDLAINDVRGILNVPELTDKCNNEECKSIFRNFKSYRSGELIQRDEKLGMGYTLYVGSLKSDIYFCIYEKDYEQYVKHGIPLDNAEVKNRFEIRLMNDRAEHAVMDLLEYRNAEHTAFGIINRYVQFLDKDENKPSDDWEVNDRWAWFLGENRNSIKLTSDPKPYSLRHTFRWLSHQVCPTWKMAQELDLAMGTNVVGEMLDNAQLTRRHEKLLEQCQMNVKDVIYHDWQ